MFRKSAYLLLIALMAVLMSSCKVLRKDRAKAVQLPEVSLAENVAQAVADSLNAALAEAAVDIQQTDDAVLPTTDDVAKADVNDHQPQAIAAEATIAADNTASATAATVTDNKTKHKGRQPSGSDPTVVTAKQNNQPPTVTPTATVSKTKSQTDKTSDDNTKNKQNAETDTDTAAADSANANTTDTAKELAAQDTSKTIEEMFGSADEPDEESTNEHPIIMALLIIALILLALALLGYHLYMRRAIANIQKSGDEALMELRMQHQREREVERLTHSKVAAPQANAERAIADLQREKDAAIQAKEAALSEMQTAISAKNAALSEKDAALSEKETAISEKQALLTEMQTAISEKDAAISEKNDAISAKEAALSEMKAAVSEKEKAEKEKAEAIKAQQDALAAKQKAEGDRDAALAKLAESNAQLAEQADALNAKDAALASKDAALATKDAELASAVAELASVKSAPASSASAPAEPSSAISPSGPSADSDSRMEELRTMRKILIGKMEMARTLLDLKGEKKGEIISADEWKDIELFLEKVDNCFVSRFAEKYPSLTKKDLQLMMLLRLKVPSKNIAAIYGINEKSVKQKLFIYKAKVGMENDPASLRDYVETF